MHGLVLTILIELCNTFTFSNVAHHQEAGGAYYFTPEKITGIRRDYNNLDTPSRILTINLKPSKITEAENLHL